MSMDTVNRVADFLAKTSEKFRDPDVYIIWHGGEPLVLPPDYFYQVGEVFDKVLPLHKEGIQTSLMPYSEKYKNVILDRFQGGIGTSVDFDARKIKGSSEAYQNKWMGKVDLARSHGFAVGLLITPAKGDLGRVKQRMDWLMERKFDYFNFERYNSFGQKLETKPSNKEHADFLIDVFEDVLGRIQAGSNVPMIPAISAVLGGILNSMPGDRWGGSCQHDFFVIEPDGSLNNCPDKASFEAPYANIKDGIEGFQNSPMRRKWIRLQQVGHRIHECETCENNVWCKSGCPITPNADPHGDETECSGYKSFITHVRGRLQSAEVMKIMTDYRDGVYTPTWSKDGLETRMLTT